MKARLSPSRLKMGENPLEGKRVALWGPHETT